jgi:predicted esterase
MTEDHYLNITQQAKYTTLGQLNGQTKEVWIVLHGYGQLAKYFIRKFSTLTDRGHFVIAPEARSKFYLNGHSGRVGATWMTKEDRLKDIENYTLYLNTLYDSFGFNDTIKITVVGFSQGAATASRWLAAGQAHVDRLLLWSGIFPSDMDILSTRQALDNTTVYNIYGTNDPYLNEEKMKEQQMNVDQLQLPVKQLSFEGAHDIDTPTLLLLS